MTRFWIIVLILAAGGASVEAKGRRAAYPAGQRDARDRAPAQRGSAANPNPAFRPPTFGDEGGFSTGSRARPAPGSPRPEEPATSNPYHEYETGRPLGTDPEPTQPSRQEKPPAGVTPPGRQPAPSAPADESEPALPDYPASDPAAPLGTDGNAPLPNAPGPAGSE